MFLQSCIGERWGKDEGEQTSEKWSSKQVGESEARVQGEEGDETKRELGGISAVAADDGVGCHVCERIFQWLRSGLVSVIE